MIRNACESDFMFCVAISRKAWPTFKERESIYHLFCKFFSNTCFVYEVDKQIQAFILGFISQVDPTLSYIHLIAVDPDFQRHGIARKLYEHFFNTARNFGALEVRLIVNPDNPISLGFHKSLGFSTSIKGTHILIDGVDSAKDYNGPGIHMVPMRRPI